MHPDHGLPYQLDAGKLEADKPHTRENMHLTDETAFANTPLLLSYICA